LKRRPCIEQEAGKSY
jgi:hypothetical protein